jgi:hypothetical protein
MRPFALSLLLGIVCSAGCRRSEAKPAADEKGSEAAAPSSTAVPDDSWGVVEVRRISTAPDPAGEPLVYAPQSLTALPDGELLVADNADRHLVLLDAKGGLERRFGPSGQGPGEIIGGNSGQPMYVWSPATDTLVVVDPGNARIARFGRAGELLGEARFPGRIPTWLAQNGTLFAERIEGDRVQTLVHQLGRVDPVRGDFVVVMALPPRAPMPAGALPGMVVGYPRPLWTVLPSGLIAVMRSDQPEISIHDADGKVVRTIHLPWKPRPRTEAEARADIEGAPADIRAFASRMKWYPTHVLGWNLLPLDDSVFALEQSGVDRPAGEPEQDGITWRIFTTSGMYGGALELPAGLSVLRVQGDRMLGLSTDSLGVPSIVELRLRRPAAVSWRDPSR